MRRPFNWGFARSTGADNIRPTPEKQAARFTGQAWPDIIPVEVAIFNCKSEQSYVMLKK
jgi:hypothetical protein